MFCSLCLLPEYFRNIDRRRPKVLKLQDMRSKSTGEKAEQSALAVFHAAESSLRRAEMTCGVRRWLVQAAGSRTPGFRKSDLLAERTLLVQFRQPAARSFPPENQVMLQGSVSLPLPHQYFSSLHSSAYRCFATKWFSGIF